MSGSLLRTLREAGSDDERGDKSRRQFDLDTSKRSRFCKLRSAFVDLLAEGKCGQRGEEFRARQARDFAEAFAMRAVRGVHGFIASALDD
jgi:hypothetical protein